MFLVASRTLGLAVETSPYSYPQSKLAVSDFDFKPYNIKYSTEVQETKRQYGLVNMASLSSIMGKRKGTVSFSVDMAWSGITGTAPDWGKLLYSCGWAPNFYSDGSIGYKTSCLHTAVPCCIEVLETTEGYPFTQTAIVIRGAMGEVDIVVESVGKPVRLDFRYTGALQSIEDRTGSDVIEPSGYNLTAAEAVINSEISILGHSVDTDKIVIKGGEEVSLLPHPATPEGYIGSHIVNRKPTCSLEPYLASIADRPYWSAITEGDTGELSIEVGSNMTITAPNIQIVSGFDGSDKKGIAISKLDCILLGIGGIHELQILQGGSLYSPNIGAWQNLNNIGAW